MEKYPILNVFVNYSSGEVKIEVSHPEVVLSIPIWYTDSVKKEISTVWIVAPNNSTLIHTALSTETSEKPLIILNPFGWGYYRINYDIKTWIKFSNLLKTSPESLPYTTRALLIDDAFNLARLGQLNYSIAFEVASYLNSSERNYYIWKETFLNLKFLYNLLRDRPGFDRVAVSYF